MTFKMSINMDNAVFDAGDNQELARIMEEVADRLRDGVVDDSIRDSNGNRVGMWRIR